jgi:hypothetical protein
MVFLGENTLRDLSGLADAFQTATDIGKKALEQRLQEPLTDRHEIERRQAELRGIKQRLKDPQIREAIAEKRAILKTAEQDVVSVGGANEEKRLGDYYTQILWGQKSRFAWLNEMGWLTELIVFFRTLFLPGIAICLPLFLFAAPIVFIQMAEGRTIGFKEYIAMIQDALKKSMPSALGQPRFAGRGGIMETGEQLVQIGVSMAMFGASIWNQVSAAVSMRKVVDDMRRRAESVTRFTEATQSLGRLLGLPSEFAIEWSMGSLGVFGDAWNNPD